MPCRIQAGILPSIDFLTQIVKGTVVLGELDRYCAPFNFSKTLP